MGGTVVNINPRDYPTTRRITVALTYKKSVTGNGPAIELRRLPEQRQRSDVDEGRACGPLSLCQRPPAVDAPCIQTRKRVTGGDLSVEFCSSRPTDPWTGLG